MIELFKYIAEKYKTPRGVFSVMIATLKLILVLYIAAPPPGKTDYILYIEKKSPRFILAFFPLVVIKRI